MGKIGHLKFQDQNVRYMANIYGYQDDVGLDRGEEKRILRKFWRSSLLQIVGGQRELCATLRLLCGDFAGCFVVLCGDFVETLWKEREQES